MSTNRPGTQAQPFIAPGFEPVAEVLADLVAGQDRCAVAAYRGHRLVVDLWGGQGFSRDTLVGVYSVSKGIAAVCVSLLVQRGALELDAPVCSYWPEFASGGKGSVSVRVLLSHRAGLLGPDGGYSLEELLGHDRLAARLAAMAPLWEPGTAHGYHGLTIGVLIEELVRRVTGTTLRDFFEREVRAPLGAEFYLGLPAPLEPRVASIIMPPVLSLSPVPQVPPAPQAAADAAAAPEHDYAAVAFNTHPGFPAIPNLPNLPAVRAVGPAAFGGVGSARGIAAIYDACLDRAGGGLLSPQTLDQVTALQARGRDLVLGQDTRYALIFQKPDEMLPFGSWRAFGHDGAGGSLAFADPLHELSFAYVTARFGGADEQVRPAYALLRAVRACLRNAGC